jgi:glucokinase
MPFSLPSSSAESPFGDEFFLAADVGGTHARIGLVRSARDSACPVELVRSDRYACAQWPGLADILEAFIAKLAETAWHGARPTSCVLACAGFVQDDQVVNYNLPWPVPISATRARLGMRQLAVINDFEALAHAVPYVNKAGMRALMNGDGASGGLAAGPIVVMGPGTGLGCAAILPDDPQPRVLSTEAAHIALAPGTPREMEILRVLASEHPHVPVEHAVSGPGLLKLYRAISTLQGQPATLSTPASVTASALDNSSPAALEALQMFCALLGSFAADLAALYGASGGIMLAGGILPQIEEFLWQSEFKMRFLRKGVMTPFLRRVPVHLIDHGELGVIGAACWFAGQHLLAKPAALS